MRNRIVQAALSLALLVLLIQVVLIAPSQIRDAENRAALLPAPELTKGREIDQRIQGFNMIETQDGKKVWELWSDSTVSNKAKETWELDVVKAKFFSDSGVTFDVSGKKGIVNVKTKDLLVTGDVVVRSSNGYLFKTPAVSYTSGAKYLSGEGEVEMHGPKDTMGHALRLTGIGMEASLEKGTMEVLRDVRAEKPVDEDRKAYIRSQRSRFSGKSNSAKFIGDVILDIDTMRMTGPMAEFQYDSERDLVKSVVFSGGARVSDANKWATAQNVRVDFDSNRFVFKGNPRVVENNDELRGDEIIFLDGGKRVSVKGARAKVDEQRLEKNP